MCFCGQMCLSDVSNIAAEADESVVKLVDHIWAEATGHLDDVLSVHPSAVTPEQVILLFRTGRFMWFSSATECAWQQHLRQSC